MLDFEIAGIGVIIAGIALILASIVMGAGPRQGRGQVKGGGVILIGPIPIILGSDAKWATLAIVLAIVLILLSLALNYRI